MADALRHRQTKGAATDMVDLTPPRHIPTLPFPEGIEHRTIHGPAPALERQSGTREIFHTGIKVIDLLAPLIAGGKAAMFGGAGVGKRDRRAFARGARAVARTWP